MKGHRNSAKRQAKSSLNGVASVAYKAAIIVRKKGLRISSESLVVPKAGSRGWGPCLLTRPLITTNKMQTINCIERNLGGKGSKN